MLPPFLTKSAFKGDSQEVTDFYATQRTMAIPGCPPLDPARLVDGQRLIQFLKPLPTTSAGRTFELREKVLGVYDKGKAGTVVESEQQLVDVDSGEIYARIVGSLFYVGQGGWNGPRGPKPPSLSPPGHRNPDGCLSIYVSPEAAHLYRYIFPHESFITCFAIPPFCPSFRPRSGRKEENEDGRGNSTNTAPLSSLNGDYNPLHATPEPGKLMGFGGIIVHGVTAYQMVAHALLRELGGSDPANIKEFQAKFVGPVRPGDQLRVEYWRMGTDRQGWEKIIFVARGQVDQKVCLSEGRALLKVQSNKGIAVGKL